MLQYHPDKRQSSDNNVMYDKLFNYLQASKFAFLDKNYGKKKYFKF